MKRIILIAALCALAQTSVFAQEKLSTTITTPNDQLPSVVVNGVAVVVNDEVITKQELQDRIRMIEQRLKAQGVALPSHAELQKQVVERMIVDRAQLQLAHDNGLRVDDIMLDRAMLRMAEQNKMTLQNFRNQVEKEGTSYAQFREGVRDDILLQRVREREVDSKVQVSESEIDNYLAAQKADTQKNQEVELSHILIRIPENATPEMLGKLRARAETVLQQVKSGGDFSKLAATYSDSAEGLKGGSLGWREQDRYPQVFIDAIANLKEGQSTNLIKSANGFHILKVTGRRTVDKNAEGIAQAHVRHILIKITPTVTKEQAIHKLEEFKQRLENNGAKFEDLAQQFSNDSSASKGGDLGWLYPGDVPEFDPVINGLKDGQISDPVESANGMHLLQLLGRKSDEVSPERQRLLARQVIHARKLDEASLDWVRQLRDRAYVEIRADDK
ncbi:peptidylprolyl isomerase [Solimicrobium silvestre]|uniref:Chaperone SurA n=1 Tax=Solimicrobium silvestre TaxID=2099400 RepID=A0A2S9H1B8_9BURK|nr:peptidylprolyl isomerase [Solimicrobium silvestre]PRC93757.1 SurA N-terminal domain [Solimicrobium silvestre]